MSYSLYVGKRCRSETQPVRVMTHLGTLWEYACDEFFNFVIKDDAGRILSDSELRRLCKQEDNERKWDAIGGLHMP